MRAKLTKPLQGLTHLTIGYNQQDTAKTLGQSKIIKPTCPFCSDILLRHMRLEGLY